MYYKLLYCVHNDRSEKIKELAIKNKGTYSTLQPESCNVENFTEYEVVFKDCNEMNSFIYSSYMTAGLYFFINEVTRTAYIF
ncbi:MAG: hypothetical protein IKR04_06140 [Clostridia bacterium]|nr:hypothetical protein [Clostridia bacterium]